MGLSYLWINQKCNSLKDILSYVTAGDMML